jgi:hypothetical protein
MGLRSMRILFCIRNPWYFRNMQTTLRELLRRGHDITLIISNTVTVEQQTHDAIHQFASEHDRLKVIKHRERGDWWLGLVNTIRSATDLIHLRGEKFAGKTRMQQRPWKRASVIVRPIVEIAAKSRFRPAVERSLALLDRCIPPERSTAKLLKTIKPDLLVVTPLIDLGCNQNELLRAATAHMIPSVLTVHSWDNLSTKSRLRTWPTRMVVWNEIQRREAEYFHGYPEERVAVSGAPHFDQWLAMHPKRGREDFLRSVNLDPAKPLVVYLCSAAFQEASEAEFCAGWVRAIRNHSDPVLATANILIRVHPKRIRQLNGYDLEDLGNVVTWPRSSINPVGDEAKDNYLSSLAYADAVMAINTTAMIEAALLGKPVFTLLGTPLEPNQTGTHHFGHLLNEGKGILRATSSMEQHLDWLRRTLVGEAPFSEEERSYVEMFARPHGRETSATELICDHIEEVAALSAEVHPVQAPHLGWRMAAVSLALTLPPVLFAERATKKANGIARQVLYKAFCSLQGLLKSPPFPLAMKRGGGVPRAGGETRLTDSSVAGQP